MATSLYFFLDGTVQKCISAVVGAESPFSRTSIKRGRVPSYVFLDIGGDEGMVDFINLSKDNPIIHRVNGNRGLQEVLTRESEILGIEPKSVIVDTQGLILSSDGFSEFVCGLESQEVGYAAIMDNPSSNPLPGAHFMVGYGRKNGHKINSNLFSR